MQFYHDTTAQSKDTLDAVFAMSVEIREAKAAISSLSSNQTNSLEVQSPETIEPPNTLAPRKRRAYQRRGDASKRQKSEGDDVELVDKLKILLDSRQNSEIKPKTVHSSESTLDDKITAIINSQGVDPDWKENLRVLLCSEEKKEVVVETKKDPAEDILARLETLLSSANAIRTSMPLVPCQQSLNRSTMIPSIPLESSSFRSIGNGHHNFDLEDHGLLSQHRPIRSIGNDSHVRDIEDRNLQLIGKALVASYQNTAQLRDEVSDGFKSLMSMRIPNSTSQIPNRSFSSNAMQGRMTQPRWYNYQAAHQPMHQPSFEELFEYDCPPPRQFGNFYNK